MKKEKKHLKPRDTISSDEIVIQKGKIENWGNSPAIKLSTKILKAAGISPENNILIISGENKITIKPIKK